MADTSCLFDPCNCRL